MSAAMASWARNCVASSVRDARMAESRALGDAMYAHKYGGHGAVADAWIAAHDSRARWAEAVYWLLLWMRECEEEER